MNHRIHVCAFLCVAVIASVAASAANCPGVPDLAVVGCGAGFLDCGAVVLADAHALEEAWMADESAVGVRPDFAH